MAISRHKVLSEMQQQLELASSKCGNLQKQLEIVKDKVRQSSTTNLLRMEQPDKENTTKTEDPIGNADANKEPDYSKALSISSSSSEDDNDERDVNIIKVFYDRLGQMEYPKSQVELSDISSVDNDLDIDQLLSSVNFSMKSNEGRKEKKVGKKGQANGNQKRKISKIKTISPYENASPKLLKPVAMTKKNAKSKPVKASDSQSASLANKSASRGQAKKPEAKTKKRKPIGTNLPIAKNSTKIFQEPIKRVMTMASQLRKTKSSTVAEKRESFADTRSLTRIHAEVAPVVEEQQAEKLSQEKHQDPPGNTHEHPKPQQTLTSPNVKPDVQKIPARLKNEIRVLNRGKAKPQIDRDGDIKAGHQDKGTSLSDLATISNVPHPQFEASKNMGNANSRATNANNLPTNPVETTASVKLMKRNDFKSRRSFEVKVPTENRERRGPERKPWTIRNPQLVKLNGATADEGGDRPHKQKNGLILYPGQETKPGNIEVKRRVDLFERVAEKEIGDGKRIPEKGRPTSKFRGTSTTITRTTSSTCDDVSRRGVESLRPPSSINTIPPTTIHEAYREKDPVDAKKTTMNQIKQIKDNLLKFNAIPFIVGQSTSKSYHIGLNIQETYSLFKQTPSMTALMAKKYADPERQSVFSRTRSTRTGFTGRRSVSSGRGRESCPACEPMPERSPEQLADPWAVPQDEENVVRVCTCLPKRMISFDQVLNQLYYSNMNLVKLHPNFLPKDRIIEEGELQDGKEKPAILPHRPTNTLYYTKLLRSIQNLKENIMV